MKKSPILDMIVAELCWSDSEAQCVSDEIMRPRWDHANLGSQFTAQEYTGRLEEAGIAVSRDGRGRALDNVFVERLWRSVKYEDLYINNYEHVRDLESGLTAYFWFYDEERLHQSIDYRTPAEVYRGASKRGRGGEKR
jgi:putative transposase